MQYTQAQIREVTRLTKEGFRHWKRVLPALEARSGRGALFSYGDIVALAVIKTIVDTFGVQIAILKDQVQLLFDTCNKGNWVILGSEIVVIGGEQGVSFLASENFDKVGAQPIICVPLSPIVARIRAVLTGDHPQQELPLSPMPVVPRRAS
jgi:hypothetical protein